mmetsp:Transcript_40924/g.113788  ORF Transcript_40924/g.113788 Transcript_40924/m.113788 type:complete len:87 (+) Transcript_40924:95-355(+)
MAGSPERPLPPQGQPREQPLRLRHKEYWTPKDLPVWRRVGAEWGGLLFFGFFMGLALIAKKYAEWQLDAVDREMSKPRRHRSLDTE